MRGYATGEDALIENTRSSSFCGKIEEEFTYKHIVATKGQSEGCLFGIIWV